MKQKPGKPHATPIPELQAALARPAAKRRRAANRRRKETMAEILASMARKQD